MGNRYEPRAQHHLKVTVSGIDLDGNAFKQSAHAHNVSRRGACLDGIGCLRGPGETIEVEHRGKKAKFFVVWVGIPATPEHDRIGIRNLDRNQNIWKVDLPKPQPDSFQLPDTNVSTDVSTEPQPSSLTAVEDFQLRQTDVRSELQPTSHTTLEHPEEPREPRPTSDRRRYRRYAIDGSATFQTKATDARTWGKLSDISPGGCYVETWVPLPAGTELEMTLEVRGVRVLVEGVVKVVYPGLGMGVEFTKIADEYSEPLEELTAPRWR